MNTAQESSRLRQNLQRVLHFKEPSANIDFYISSLTEHNPFYSTDEIINWLEDFNRHEYFSVQPLPFAEMENWHFDPWSGDLQHDSGRFFSIRGLDIHTEAGPVNRWTQPIIDQPEIGVLGIVAKEFDGILYLLLQAKAEPGNINSFQLSPTVQATRSNYLQVHGGKATRFLEVFLGSGQARVLIDQLQSEQGARFYRKRNRNIIVQVADDEILDINDSFRWVTLGQLKRLALIDNTVNMDCRSIISSICYDPEVKTSLQPVQHEHLKNCLENSPLVSKPITDLAVKTMISAHGNTPTLHSEDELLKRLAAEKFACELSTRLIALNEVRDWVRSPTEISHIEGRYFSVLGVRVSAANREVEHWDQPIIKQIDHGIVGFVSKEINGVLHFLVQLKMECGNMDILEIAPTVQCITDSYLQGERPRFLEDLLDPQRGQWIFDTLQSEEGGRFYREANRNLLLLANEEFPQLELPRYLWLNIWQLKRLLRFSNFLNVEARSLISII